MFLGLTTAWGGSNSFSFLCPLIGLKGAPTNYSFYKPNKHKHVYELKHTHIATYTSTHELYLSNIFQISSLCFNLTPFCCISMYSGELLPSIKCWEGEDIVDPLIKARKQPWRCTLTTEKRSWDYLGNRVAELYTNEINVWDFL